MAEPVQLPLDPALPGLRWLRANALSPRPVFPPPYVIIEHRPGRRMIIRAGIASPAWLRLYPDGRGESIAERHRILTGMCGRSELPFRVPPVMGFVPEANLVALGHLAGTEITMLRREAPEGAQPDAAPDAGDPLVRALPAAAAAIHALHASAFEPGHFRGVTDEAELVKHSTQILCLSAKRSAKRVHRLGGTIISRLTSVPAGGTIAPIHHNLRPVQVLWSERDAIALLDWDDAATGPALLDVAGFAAHLRLEAFHHPGEAARWRDAGQLFVASYMQVARPETFPDVRPFLAAALFRLAAAAIERGRNQSEADWLIEEASHEVPAGRALAAIQAGPPSRSP